MAVAEGCAFGRTFTLSEALVRCALDWTSTAGVDLDLAAVLVTSEGDCLGSVDGHLAEHAANVDRQWASCGVKHSGDQAGKQSGHEEINLDLNLLANVDLVQYVFLVVNVHDASSKLSGLQNVSVKVCAHPSGREVCASELSQDTALNAMQGAVTAVVARCPGNAWKIMSMRVPLTSTTARDSFSLLGTLAARVPSQLQDSSPLPAAGHSVPDEALSKAVGDLEAAGDYAGAVAAQEALVSKLLGGSSQCTEAVLDTALKRLEELQRRMSVDCEASAGDVGATSPLSEAGYQQVAATLDTLAMRDFIQRVVVERGGRIEDEGKLNGFAPWYSGERATQSFARLVEELHEHSWTSLPRVQEPMAWEGASVPPVCHTLRSASKPEGSPAAPAGPPAAAEPTSNVQTLGGGFVAPPPPPVVAEGEVSFEPRSGSVRGGTQLQWTGEGPPPQDIRINGRPCAALADGVFIVPFCAGEAATKAVDAVLIDANGSETVFPRAFVYWAPGQFLGVHPPRGPLTGDRELQVSTSDLGAPIAAVVIGGVECELVGEAEASSAVVKLPPAEAEGGATVEVRCSNGNGCSSSEDVFTYFAPVIFGMIGDNVELSEEGARATRKEGVNRGVCIGAFPLKRLPEGRYFEVVVTEMDKGAKTFAVGVTLRQDEEWLNAKTGRLKAGVVDATCLKRVWVAGYDSAGAKFFSDGAEAKIPTKAWRPVKDVHEGDTVGVLWSEPEEGEAAPEVVIFQNGSERYRQPVTGRPPAREEQLFALVDLLGNVKSVRLKEDAVPPRLPPEPEGGEADAAG